MRNWTIFCLIPLSGVLGALLGGYRPVDLEDPVVESKLRPVLEFNSMLGSLPIKRVEQQRVIFNFFFFFFFPSKNTDNQLLQICLLPSVASPKRPKELSKPTSS